MSAPVLIMAGGTGGHVFPALAIAQVLAARQRRVVWLGTRRGIESRLVPAAGLPLEFIDIEGLRGKGALGWVLAPFKLTRAIVQARAVIRRIAPGVVLGCGGFASGPGGVAARLCGRPLVIHEQNAIAGLTNRLLSRIAYTVAQAFPGSFGSDDGVETVGNPVRAAIAALPAPAQRFAGRDDAPRLLVIGGSQGARVLNRTLPLAIAQMPASERPQVWHQTGERDHAATLAAYGDAGITARVTPFIDDMPVAYGWADLAVCRSGALTIAELAAAGLGAILVPFAAAVDDHQTANARFLVDAGAAELKAESTLEAADLATSLRRLLTVDRRAAHALAEAARRVAIVDAAERMADLCLAAEREAQ